MVALWSHELDRDEDDSRYNALMALCHAAHAAARSVREANRRSMRVLAVMASATLHDGAARAGS